MIKSNIIHPELLSCLAKCGHKTNILIADGNYSCVTNSGANADIIYLNFKPGILASTEVMAGVTEMLNIEGATMMACPAEFDNTIISEYQSLLPEAAVIDYVDRATFYAAVKSDDTLLVIATGEQRRFANILLTVGVVF